MQFSIFGVPFKLSKEMFGREQLKHSLCAYWALAWRGLVFGLVWGSVLGSLFIFNVELRELFLEAVLHQTFPSIEFWLSVDGFVLVLLLIGLFLGMSYIQYYGLFKKNYKTFQKDYSDPSISKTSFLSKNFWRPWLLTAIFGVVVGQIVKLVVEVVLPELYVIAFSFFIGFLLFHFYLHGDTWGFVPKKREN